ncbi:hypothetical protein D3C80_1499260 [compost metagenome]
MLGGVSHRVYRPNGACLSGRYVATRGSNVQRFFQPNGNPFLLVEDLFGFLDQ